MEITEVRIKLMEDPQERLQAFCSITINGSFVIRDLKIIEGLKGSFVAMPSRKLTDRCPQCGAKNHLRAGFCNQCGVKLMEDRATKDTEGRARLYADIAHPINSRCRELIQETVITAFQQEQIKALQPGYVCRYDDFGEDGFAELAEPMTGDNGFSASARFANGNSTAGAESTGSQNDRGYMAAGSSGSNNGFSDDVYPGSGNGVLIPRPGSDGQLRIDAPAAESVPTPHTSPTEASAPARPVASRESTCASSDNRGRDRSSNDDFGDGVLGNDS